MFAGRVGSWDRLQYRVRIEPEMQETDGEAVSGILSVPFAPDLSTLSEYLKLTLTLASQGDYGVGVRTARVDLGNLSWQVTQNTTIGAHELIVEFHEPRWYVSPLADGTPAWEFRWSDLRIYINGAQVTHTLPTAGSVRNDTYFAPAGLPMTLTRLDAQVQTGEGIVTGDPYNPCESSSLVTRAFVRVVGGWRVREHDADDWTAFPIRVPQMAWRGDPCNNLSANRPEVDGTTTWNATVSRHEEFSVYHNFLGQLECPCYCNNEVNGSATFRVFKRTTTSKNHSASLWIVPDVPKRMTAIGENVTHEYLMYRERFPRVGVLRYWAGVHTETRCPNPDPVVICSQNNIDTPETVVLHDSRAPLLWVHDGAAGNPLNEPTDEPTYCPYTAGVDVAVFEETITCLPEPPATSDCPICPGDADIGSYLLPPLSDPCCSFDSSGVKARTRRYLESHTWVVDDNCHPHYRHASPAARYFGTHAAPFWSYISWLQDWALDRNGDGVAEPTPVADYWRPHQCQHIDHPALPEAIRSRRRSYLLLDALVHGTWSAWINDLFGVPSGWVGSSRPALVEWLGVSERALTEDSAPRWTAQNATLVFTPAGITVTPTATTHTLEFTLADWSVEPYLYPAVADRVRIWLPDTAYTAIAIQLMSAEDETVTIATARGTHAIPSGADSKYAGTWRRQYAAAAAGYSELGWDWDTDGVSQATFADGRRALLWQLLGTRAGAKLRITVTQAAPTPYLMEYPRFYRDTIQHAFAADNGAHTYPHIRSAQMLNFGLLAYPIASDTPSVRLPHQPMTLYDAAALYLQLDLAESASSTAAIMAQILAWGFDNTETGGHPAGVPRVRQMCRAAMLPYTQRLALWLINDLRECPPLPTLPTRKYRNAPLGFTGEWGQWIYFCAPSHRYYLAPDEPAKLMEVQGASETELTAYDRAIGRYHLTRQAIALDGTETLQHASRQWRIRTASRDLARTTPFFSHALVPPAIVKPEGGAQVVIDTRRQYLHVAVGSTLRTYHLHSRQLILQREYDGRIECLARDSRRDALLIVVREAGVRIVYLSRDAGDTAVEVLRMTTAGLVVCAISPHMTWIAIYQGAGNALMMRRSIDGGASWSSPQQVEIDGNPAQGVPLDAVYDARYHAVVLAYETASGDRRVALSHDDGETFVTILQ